MAVDAKGDLYVADWANDRIQRFSSEGEYRAQCGRSGSADGQFRWPSAVVVDEEARLYGPVSASFFASLSVKSSPSALPAISTNSPDGCIS